VTAEVCEWAKQLSTLCTLTKLLLEL